MPTCSECEYKDKFTPLQMLLYIYINRNECWEQRPFSHLSRCYCIYVLTEVNIKYKDQFCNSPDKININKDQFHTSYMWMYKDQFHTSLDMWMYKDKFHTSSDEWRKQFHTHLQMKGQRPFSHFTGHMNEQRPISYFKRQLKEKRPIFTLHKQWPISHSRQSEWHTVPLQI